MLPHLTSQQLRVGSEYHTHFKIPLIGRQNIDFTIHHQNYGQIKLSGIVTRQDFVTFNVTRNGKVTFQLGDDLRSFMRKYKSEIKYARYDRILDRAVMVIKIRPIHFTTELILRRKFTEN